MRRLRKLFKVNDNEWSDGIEHFKFEKLAKVKENVKEHESKDDPHPKYRKKDDRIDIIDDIILDDATIGIVLKDDSDPPNYWRLQIKNGKLEAVNIGDEKPPKKVKAVT